MVPRATLRISRIDIGGSSFGVTGNRRLRATRYTSIERTTYARWPQGIIRRMIFLWRGIVARGTKAKNSMEPRVHLFWRFTNPRTFSGRASHEWSGRNAEPWPREASATAVAKSSETYPSVKPPSSRTGRGRTHPVWPVATTDPGDPAGLPALPPEDGDPALARHGVDDRSLTWVRGVV